MAMIENETPTCQGTCATHVQLRGEKQVLVGVRTAMLRLIRTIAVGAGR